MRFDETLKTMKRERDALSKAITALESLTAPPVVVPTPPQRRRGKYVRSKTARRHMAEAQLARWARIKAAQPA